MAGRPQNLSPGQEKQVRKMIQEESTGLTEGQRREISQVLHKKVHRFAVILVLIVGGGLLGILANVRDRVEDLVAQ